MRWGVSYTNNYFEGESKMKIVYMNSASRKDDVRNEVYLAYMKDIRKEWLRNKVVLTTLGISEEEFFRRMKKSLNINLKVDFQ